MTSLPPAPPRASPLAAIARWLVAIGLALVGTFFARRYIIRLRARAATRLVLTDFARYQGCILGAPLPTDAEAPLRVRSLALGSGDDAWPHSCAPALTRLEHTADDMHGDDAAADALAAAVRRAENGLGEAVFWVGHEQDGHPTDPTWLGTYFELRRAVEAFARSHGAALLAPEFPRHPRIPHAIDATPRAPRPVALPGGAGADLIDATATPDGFAVVMRDGRSRDALCQWPVSPADAPIACRQFTLPNIADPRYAGFVNSERGPHLAVWGRAPYSLRGLVDAAGVRVVLIAAGDPDATRDYFVGPHAIAVQVDREGPALLVEERGFVRHVALPRGADVLTAERALLGGIPGTSGALEAWLDGRSHTSTTLEAVTFDASFHPGRVATVARWSAPRMRGADRRVVPCTVPGGPRYLAAGDREGGTLFVHADGPSLTRGPEIPMAFDPPPRIVCDTRGITLATGGSPTSFAHCDRLRCTVQRDIPVAPGFAMARADGQLVLADATAEGTLRVRTVDPVSAVVHDSHVEGPAPAARTLRLAARDRVVALFVGDREMYALRSTDAGATFAPAVVAR